MSPRKDGNSELLLSAFLRGAEQQGTETETVRIAEQEIRPCNGCGICGKFGFCPMEDDFLALSESMMKADAVVISTPLYFMNVPSVGKAFIDRCQIFWAAEKRTEANENVALARYGAVLAVAGANKGLGGTDLFRGLHDTMACFFDAIDMKVNDELYVPGVDEKGALLNCPQILDDAEKLGRSSVSSIGDASTSK